MISRARASVQMVSWMMEGLNCALPKLLLVLYNQAFLYSLQLQYYEYNLSYSTRRVRVQFAAGRALPLVPRNSSLFTEICDSSLASSTKYHDTNASLLG